MSPSSAAPITWRYPTWVRVLAVVGLGIMMLAMVALSTVDPLQPYTWAVMALLVFNLLGVVRRSCSLEDRRMTARGRLATRVIELADLRQAGMGLGSVWVQTHGRLDKRGGDVLSLRMIPTGTGGLLDQAGGVRAVELIRLRAEAAGAKLDEPLVKTTRPPSRKPLIFSI